MILSPAVSTVTALAGMAAVFVWRVQEGRSAVTLRKIVIPPLGMATGFSMFLVPGFRVPLLWGLLAFTIGAIALAYPLLATSKLERDGDRIMMKRSGAFFAVVIVLAAIRFAARSYLDQVISVEQTAGLFYVLAFGMILRWRMKMLLQYRALVTVEAE